MSRHEFKFKRGALKLHIVISGGQIGASLYLHGKRQTMHAAYIGGAIFRLCYLQLGTPPGTTNLDGTVDLPCLWMERSAVDLRDSEVAKLRAVLEPLGVDVRPRKPIGLKIAGAFAPPSRDDRMFAGEVEGCGGDAELDRTRC